MKSTRRKLELNKFKVAQINNPYMILGGDGDEGDDVPITPSAKTSVVDPDKDKKDKTEIVS